MTTFKHLLSPLKIGPKTTRNRVLVSGHQPSMTKNGLPTSQYVAYQKARARGGAGLQITGATGVHRTGAYAASHGALVNLDDSIIDGYRRISDGVHAEGGLILAQLTHAGSVISSDKPNTPLWAPSPTQAELIREIPHEITKAELIEVVDAFHSGAERVKAGGMDGVEILSAYGLLLGAFLSPLTNLRTDELNGSLENRMGPMLMVVDAVRDGVGDDCIVGMRIAADELVEGGLRLPDMQEVAKRLAATGKLDYLNVIGGTNNDRIQRIEHWASTPMPHGRFVPLAEGIKQVVDIPVFTVGRIVDPQHAESILADGKADMVGMTRAHIADPNLVRKVRQGKLADIRPCIGANVCISRGMAGTPITCIYNPETGREEEWSTLVPTDTPKQIVVIGGGPAGLETARISAMRGHRVTLFEKEAELGGQFRLWAKNPALAEFHKAITWQTGQLEQFDVDVRLNSPVTATTPELAAADVVVLATGSKPHLKPVAGSDGSDIKIVPPHALFAEFEPPKHGLVYCDGNGQAGLAAAEMLIEAGAKVTLATPGFAIGEDLNMTIRVPIYQRLHKAGAQFISNHTLEKLSGDTVILNNVYSGDNMILSDIDLIVQWSGNQVADELTQSLRDQEIEFHVVGDVMAPRTMTVAVAEAAILARAL